MQPPPARRIAITAPDGTPVSVTELASDANFIAKSGGTVLKERSYKTMKVHKCTNCGFDHQSFQDATQHIVKCTGVEKRRGRESSKNFMRRLIREGVMTIKMPETLPAGTVLIPARIDEVLADDTPPETIANDALATLVGMTGLCISDEAETEAGSVVPSSVATSAITLQSTLHSRERIDERELTRRDLQSAVKHGETRRSHTGNWIVEDEKTCVVIASGDAEEGAPAPRGKVVVTAWGK
tara:strand:- start:1511 stop:2230 length:720 start_codon:yes stop_codon:yes gene_type:complete